MGHKRTTEAVMDRQAWEKYITRNAQFPAMGETKLIAYLLADHIVRGRDSGDARDELFDEPGGGFDLYAAVIGRSDLRQDIDRADAYRAAA